MDKSTRTAKGRKARITKTPEERRAELERLQASIAEQVAQLTTTEGWARFLKAAAGFHRYSLSNLLLIQAQRPGATQVAGFRQWQERGRQVRKGEKGIRIFGYSTKKPGSDEDDEAQDPSAGPRAFYPVLSVFDISQTDPIDGIEVADIAPRLTGEDPTGIYNAAAAWLAAEGWTIVRAPLHGEDGHTTSDGSRRIAIEENLEPAHAALTLLHEAAHALLHEHIDDHHQHRGLYETEAESVAYVAAAVLGLDTSRNSIGYIATWTGGDVSQIKSTAARVLAAADQILDSLTA